MSKQLKDLSTWIEEEVFKKPFKDVKLIAHLDSYEVAIQVALVLRKSKDEPLTHIFSSVGSSLLRMTGEYKHTDDSSVLYVWLGNRVLLPLIDNGIVEFDNEKEDSWNGSIASTPWRVTKNGNQILVNRPKLVKDGYVLAPTEVGEKWLDDLFDALPEEEGLKSESGLPQFEDILPYETFYHETTGMPMIHGAPRRIRRKIDQGKYPKFVEILNSRMKLKYTIDQEIIDVYDACQRDALFTLKNKKMNAKQKKSVKDERKFAIQDARACGDREFSFYHFYDRRVGRIYSEGHFLKPDGSKVSKSMLRLADKKRIGEKGYKWLLVNASNTYGNDKGGIDSRVQFAEEHLDEWMVWASDPINHKGKKDEDGNVVESGWTIVDDPFNFLAAILELHRAHQLEDKHDYESGLIVALDAAQSGLQILSALVNDEVSGAMCNIFGFDSSDFYLTIADEVWKDFMDYTPEELKIYHKVMKALNGVTKRQDFNDKLEELGDDFAIAGKVYWALRHDVRRKLSKRPCMTYFYSCQKETMASAIYKDWRTEEGFEDINPGFAIILSEKLYDTCKRVMRKPSIVMDVIIEMALEDKMKGHQFWCRTPYTGVIMEQTYFKRKPSKRVACKKSIHNADKFKLNVWNGYDETKIDHNKVKSASSPNFVHMLDSQLVAWCIDNCDYNVSCIHDSFGAVAADVDYLFDDIRAGFYELFSKPVLKNTLEKKGYSHLYAKLEFGNGNLQDVLYNEECFS